MRALQGRKGMHTLLVVKRDGTVTQASDSGSGYMALEPIGFLRCLGFLICNRKSVSFKFQHLQFVATLGDADTTQA